MADYVDGPLPPNIVADVTDLKDAVISSEKITGWNGDPLIETVEKISERLGAVEEKLDNLADMLESEVLQDAWRRNRAKSLDNH